MSSTEACVIWAGRIAPNGYGTKGRLFAHRLSLAEKLGRPIAPGMDACHTCDVRAAYAATATAALLTGLLDEYDRLTGRTEHRHVSDTELRALAAAI